MKKHFLFLFILFLAAGGVRAQGKLDVVTSLPDLASIARAIGGDRVSVMAVAAGYQNPHFVDPKPSYIVKLSKADVFVTVGLDLETGWVPALLNSARNPKILKGGAGYVDASVNVPLLQVPSSTSREQGDIHIYGNPHYWLDPDNGKIIADNIEKALARLQPESKDYFEANLARFKAQIDRKDAEWKKAMAPLKGMQIIAYHNEWPYFAGHFGLEIVDFLEPKPGIPPTPSQLAKVIGEMQRGHIQIIINSPYFKQNSAELVARKVGGEVVELATSVEAYPEVKDYFALFDYNVQKLTGASAKGTH